MSLDFCAGYISGAAGILIGNPLDLVKVRLQAGAAGTGGGAAQSHFESVGTLIRGLSPYYTSNIYIHEVPLSRWTKLAIKKSCDILTHFFLVGAPAPILGYGALNALLFVSYHRTLSILGDDISNPSSPLKIWCAGAVGGLATWLVSAPTEFVKCRAQISSGNQSSWSIAKDTIKHAGLRGLYFGGLITSLRDSIGYGF